MKRGSFLDIQWSLLIPVIVLVILSLTTLFSINSSFFKNQAFYLGVSLLAFIIFSNVNYKLLKFYSLPIYIISIIVLTIVLVLGIESRGAVRWMDIFGIRIQFSEFFKPFLAVSLASYLAGRENLSFKTFLSSILLTAPILFLILIQPDLGNAIIYGLVAFFTFLIFGFSYLWFLAGGLIAIAMMPIFWRFMHEYQRQRVLTFINPTRDPLGLSYNVIQSMVAVGSGMFLGKGLGEGTQSGLRFLPERHTDFIFATFTEEFGFLGAMVLILAFVFLFYKIYMIFQNSEDKSSKLFVGAAFFLILVQFFINIGMNIGLLPIVGVTLPFVSYGGSSLLSNFILLGLVASIARGQKNKNVLEIG